MSISKDTPVLTKFGSIWPTDQNNYDVFAYLGGLETVESVSIQQAEYVTCIDLDGLGFITELSDDQCVMKALRPGDKTRDSVKALELKLGNRLVLPKVNQIENIKEIPIRDFIYDDVRTHKEFIRVNNQFIKLLVDFMVHKINPEWEDTISLSFVEKTDAERCLANIKDMFGPINVTNGKHGYHYIVEIADKVITQFLVNVIFSYFPVILFGLDISQIKFFSKCLFNYHSEIAFSNYYDYIQPVRMVLARANIWTKAYRVENNQESVHIKLSEESMENGELFSVVTGLSHKSYNDSTYHFETLSGTYCTDCCILCGESK